MILSWGYESQIWVFANLAQSLSCAENIFGQRPQLVDNFCWNNDLQTLSAFDLVDLVVELLIVSQQTGTLLRRESLLYCTQGREHAYLVIRVSHQCLGVKVPFKNRGFIEWHILDLFGFGRLC